jgi:hypothetical protein
MSSFTNKKALKFILTLGTGKFGSSDNDTLILEGFRALCYIEKAGGTMFGTLQAKIYGVSMSHMNSITTTQWKNPDTIIPNTVQVYAVDGSQSTLVFQGNIINAWGDFRGMPDAYLHIQAQEQYMNKIQAVPPVSYKGQIDVATIMSQLAGNLGLAFENNGVNVQLSDVYLANTGTEQAMELAKMAGCTIYFDNQTLAIAPKNTPRGGQNIPLISKDTGLVGYPTFDGIGVVLRCLFNPAIGFGKPFQLATDIPRANGQWFVVSMSHHLESEMPGGEWFTMIRGNQSGLAITQ